MAAQRTKSTRDLKNENKNGSNHNRFAISTSNASVHQAKGNGLKLKLKLKPNPTMVRQAKSKFKSDVDEPFTETQNSPLINLCNENSTEKSVKCCCCCSGMCSSKIPSVDEQTDTSLLREPLNMGKTNVKQILQCVHNGTVEVKDIVLNECNIIYECRVCRNLFRSLANLLSHKRFYCTKHCCEKMILFDSTTINYGEESVSEQASKVSNDTSVNSSQLPLDVTTKESSVEKDTNSFIDACVQKVNLDEKRKRKSEFQFKLVRIPTNNNAVYQKVVNCNDCDESNAIETEASHDSNEVVPVEAPGDSKSNEANQCEQSSVQYNVKSEPCSTNNRARRKRKSPSVPSESTPLKVHSLRSPTKSPESKSPSSPKVACCDICNAAFTSKKTLRVHMKTIHAVQRLIYPCPFCCMTFKQLSNGTRHMSQIHKKNKTQVKSLREVLRARAYPETNDSRSAASDDSEDESSDEDDEEEEQDMNADDE